MSNHEQPTTISPEDSTEDATVVTTWDDLRNAPTGLDNIGTTREERAQARAFAEHNAEYDEITGSAQESRSAVEKTELEAEQDQNAELKSQVEKDIKNSRAKLAVLKQNYVSNGFSALIAPRLEGFEGSLEEINNSLDHGFMTSEQAYNQLTDAWLDVAGIDAEIERFNTTKLQELIERRDAK